jgi:serine protease AprX
MVTNKKLALLFLTGCFLSFIFECTAQRKYWIKLTDKNGTPYSISTPSLFLTQKSIARRSAYNIPYNNSDLPVNPSYVNQIKNVPSVTVLYVSKWLNGVVISVVDSVALAALSTIHGFSFVVDTGRVKRYHLNIPLPEKVIPENDQISAKGSGANRATAYDYGGSLTQNQQLDLVCLHENGYRGQGMTIAVLDAGFLNANINPAFDTLRKNGGILGTRNFCDGGTNVYSGDASSHGTAVLSCMAANVPGAILGSAPLAKYWLLKTEEAGETISEEYNWIRGAEFADSVGADILTTSLGYTDFDIPSQNHTYATLNGRTAPMSIAATMAARKGMFVLNAAGNEGDGSWHYISVPGDADSICTVGAVDGSENFQSFSGVGPTADGRIKPDLLARGSGSWISDPMGTNFGPGNGTSFATPILAGAVACFWQVNRYLNNIQLLDTLRKLGTRAATPSYTTGWGVPKLTCAPPCPAVASFSYVANGNGRVDLVSTSTGTHSGTQYTWVFGDGTFASGTSASHVYASGIQNSFNISLFVDNKTKQTCIDSSETISVKVFRDVITVPPDFDFTVHSNWPNSVISINLTKTTYQFVSIEIFDLLGHSVFVVEQKNGQTEFNLDSSVLPNAYYIVRVKTSRGTKTKKLFKQ